MNVSTTSARHLLLRLGEGSTLPDALHAALRDEVVLCGWLRASGVLTDVELRVAGREATRALAGPLQVVALEGSVGLADGDVSCGLRAVLARETDAGLETLAGEIASARVLGLEVLVTAFDDVAATRRRDASGAWLLDPTSAAPREAAAAPAPAPPPPAPSAPAVAPAPAPAPTAAPAPKPPAFGAPAALPLRPVRPAVADEDEGPTPEPGDVAEHFAFGRCEVMKTDGDRLHVRLGKDGRIKEIALEMLRVSPLPPEEGQTTRRWKLDRKL